LEAIDLESEGSERVALKESAGLAIEIVDVCRMAVAGLAKARSGTRNAALIPNKSRSGRGNFERRFRKGDREKPFTPWGIVRS
jgi:hypothetical protein